jgi:cytochrome b561
MMPIKNSAERWGSVSIGLHWLTFLLIVGLGTVGLIMTDLPTSPFKIQIYTLHKSFGLTVFALSLLRVLWRLVTSVPKPEPGSPRWQNSLATVTHGALYALLLAIPLSGWLFNSAAGFPLKWFGLFALPKLSGFNPGLKAFARDMHETLFYVLAALVLIHAAAALYHHYRLRDRVLARMLPMMTLLLMLPGVSVAADWTMQPGSTLGFSASYQGEVFQGRFGKFTPQIRFDPAKLADSRFDVRIALASASTNNSERDELLVGEDFFASAKLPEARYSASKFRALGGNRFAADGTLSLRGVNKPVTLTFIWTPGAKAVLVGEATLKRLDFGVGSGDWTDTGLIPNEVKVSTRLVLAPAM